MTSQLVLGRPSSGCQSQVSHRQPPRQDGLRAVVFYEDINILHAAPVPSIGRAGADLLTLNPKATGTWLRSVAASFQALVAKWMLWLSWILDKW